MAVLTNIRVAKVVFYAGCDVNTIAMERYMALRYKTKALDLEKLVVEGFEEPVGRMCV